MGKYEIILIAIMITFAGCSGFIYKNSPALEFQDIDYGFPTKTAMTNPYISYIDVGKGDKTIVLVHGLASNAGFWRYAIPELSKNCRVIAVDLPGYGKSQKDAYPYGMTFYAEQIKKLIDELKLGKVILVGHSMGGQIAITFSLKYPDRLEKLILASPAGLEEFQQGQGDWLKSVMTKSGVKKTYEDGIRKNLAMNFYSWDDKLEWMVEERTRMAKGKDFDEFCYTVVRCVSAMLDEPTFNKLGNIKVPTLIVYGKNDGLIPNPYLNPGFPADIFQSGAGRIPNCKTFEIEECGHLLQIEKPQQFTSAILNFMK